MSAPETVPVLQVRSAVKRYGGITALNRVSFAVESGSVHALLGENGAGKSTLVKIIAGAVGADEGEVLLDGGQVHFTSTRDAGRHGVAIVSQELNLFADLDVLANIFLLREHVRFGLLDRKRMERLARPILDELGVTRSVHTPVKELSLADRQLVEIARALATNPRVLVLDEPTSALDDRSSGRLLELMGVLRQRRVGVVFVTHTLEEVKQVADQVTIMCDGIVAVAAAPCESLTIKNMVDAMLGAHRRAAVPGAADPIRPERATGGRLVLDRAESAGLQEPVSLDAGAGEIVGLAGLAGAGHQVVLELVSGTRRTTRGSVLLPGGRPVPRGLAGAVRHGVAIVSGDRGRGLVSESPIWLNIAHVRSISLGGDGPLPRRQLLRERATRRADAVGVKAPDVNARVGSLSGGNQQKVVLAKWLEAEPTVLLLDDPTRGVDVGAKAEMHALVREACQSRPVLLCSTDLDELVEVCDRVLVFRAGRLVRELAGVELNRHSLLAEMNEPEAASATG